MDDSQSFKLNYFAGTIDKTDELRFERTIFRATKGNVWCQII